MGVMPYQLEKGLFPLVIEHYFNQGLDAIAVNAPLPTAMAQTGPQRRLRAIWRYRMIVAALRGGNYNTIRVVTAENSIIYSQIFDQTAQYIPNLRSILAEDWFGMVREGDGWRRQRPADWLPPQTTGMWNGYYGNVELIVCETLLRMLEVSLGIPHGRAVPQGPNDESAFEQQLASTATRVWPLCLFLTCPKPWFECWVTWQCHDKQSALRGQVTVLLATPGHRRPATPSPIDVVGDLRMVPVEDQSGQPVVRNGVAVVAPNPYYLHGVDADPFNSGYVGRYVVGQQLPTRGAEPVAPRVPANHESYQGMWVITHDNHDSTVLFRNFVEPDHPNWDPNREDSVQAWDFPPIATFRPARLAQRADLPGPGPDPYQISGYYDVTVVEPASLDGGIPFPPFASGDANDA
jgi:hypothetical protein